MICSICGKEYFTRAKYCSDCVQEKKKEYLRNYARTRDSRETIKINREDYQHIKQYAKDNNIPIYKAVHILINS